VKSGRLTDGGGRSGVAALLAVAVRLESSWKLGLSILVAAAQLL
jgi:hypothetical protein